MISISLGLLYYLSSTFRIISIFTDLERRDAPVIFNKKFTYIKYVSGASVVLLQSGTFRKNLHICWSYAKKCSCYSQSQDNIVSMSPVLLCYFSSTCRNISILILREEVWLLFWRIKHILNMSLEPQWYLSSTSRNICFTHALCKALISV